MNNTFEINVNGAVKLFPMMFSIVKEEEQCSFKTPLSEDNLSDIKNLLIKAYTSTNTGVTLEKIKDLIDNMFASSKTYSSFVKRVEDKYTIVDLFVLCANNSSAYLARDTSGYYGNSNGYRIISMQDSGYLYMRVAYSGNHLGNGDSCVSYYSKERRDAVGETNLMGHIASIYLQINPSCSFSVTTDVENPKSGRRERFVNYAFCSTVEEAFAMKVPEKKFGIGATGKYYYIYAPLHGFLYLSSNKRMRASIVGGNLLLRDANDILNEKYIEALKNISAEVNYPMIFIYNKFAPYAGRNEVNYGAGFTSGKVKTVLINSVPKEFIVQSKNIMVSRTQDNTIFTYDLLIKTKNIGSRWVSNRIYLNNGYPAELAAVYEEGKDNLSLVLSMYAESMLSLKNQSLEQYKGVLSTFYSESDYISMIKSINEGNSVIDTWFKQCCEQGAKNKEKLAENYKLMRDRLLKEKTETTIYLNHHDFSKCLPIPAIDIKDISLQKAKTEIGFNMLGITYTRLGKIDIQPLEEKKLFVRAMVNNIPKANNRRDRVGVTQKVIDADIIDFYNAKENTLIFSQEKMKEAAK